MPLSGLLRTGRRNRLKPPFKSRQRCASSLPDGGLQERARVTPARGPPTWDLPSAIARGGDHHAQAAPEYEFDQRVAW